VKIALLADLHFGRIAGPEIVSALVTDIAEQDADLVVLAGDLTQRARPREYRAAARFIGHLKAPVLAVSGNHDVYPWWHLVPRLWFPLRRFYRWITPQRFPLVEAPGVVVLGISSATGRRLQRGVVALSTQLRMIRVFQSYGSSVRTVLLVHHPPRHATVLRPLLSSSVTDAGPDVILCGHTHVSNAGVRYLSGHPIVVVQSGTATSNRWRTPQMDTNSYQTVDISKTAVNVEERRYDLAVQVFGPWRRCTFRLQCDRGWVEGVDIERQIV